MTYADKASYVSSPPCILKVFTLFAPKIFEKISSIAPETNKEQFLRTISKNNF